MAVRIKESEARKLFLKNKLDPIVPFPGTQKPWKSKCLVTGKLVAPTYGKVRDYGHRCIHCSRSTVDPHSAAKLMKQKGFLPLIPFPGTNSPWKSKCKTCGKTTSPTYWNVAKGTGCKFCSNRAVDPKMAIVSMKERGFTVLEPFPGATKKWKVKCDDCKRKMETTFHSLKTKRRCPYCQRSKLDLDEISQTLHKLDLQPLENFPGARKPWKLRCKKCKIHFERRYEKLTRVDRKVYGCPYCSRRRIDPNFAKTWMTSAGVQPLEKYPGGKRPWKCMCNNCKEIVYPRWDDVRKGQGACSNCADFGLNYSKPGYLYLITNSNLNCHKIGIANSYKTRKFDDRMYRHSKQGWRIYEKLEFKTLRKAKKVESDVLKWMRLELELPIHLSRKQMPQGGFSETVDASEIDPVTIWNKVEEIKDRNNDLSS